MALLDKPPPSRWTIKEIKGRLVVFDNETGAPPLSAAERMALFDEQAGHRSPTAPTTSSANPSHFAKPPTDDAPPLVATPQHRGQSQRKSQNPWGSAAVTEKPTPQPHSRPKGPQSGTATSHQTPTALHSAHAQNSTAFTTSSAWDSKGPRPIQLGEVGRQHLSKMLFITIIGLMIFEIFIWSQDAGSAVLVHALLVAILWGQRAEIGRRILDHLVALDEKSQL